MQYELFVETGQTRAQSETIILSVQFPVLLNVIRIAITRNFSGLCCSTPLLAWLEETLEEVFRGIGYKTISYYSCVPSPC